jgi:hypothetical protein
VTTIDNRKYAENRPIQPPYSQGHQVPDGATVPNTSAVTLKPANEPVRVPLDDMKTDLENLELAEKLIAEWEETRKVLRGRIAEKLGPNGIGTVAGREVWAHTPTARFAAAKFAKEQPELAAQFTEHRVVTEVNSERLKNELPGVYATYQVSSLRPLGSRSA